MSNCLLKQPETPPPFAAPMAIAADAIAAGASGGAPPALARPPSPPPAAMAERPSPAQATNAGGGDLTLNQVLRLFRMALDPEGSDDFLTDSDSLDVEV